jgi:AraC-like DNA-binding protein
MSFSPNSRPAEEDGLPHGCPATQGLDIVECEACRSGCQGPSRSLFLRTLQRRMPSPLLRDAVQLIRTDPTRFVSVGEWASELGVSREHLTRRISPVVTPHTLLMAARLCAAVWRLRNQAHLHADDALDALGYNSRAHAFAMFKRYFGVTPAQFWQTNRANDPTGDVGCGSSCCPMLAALVESTASPGRISAEN